MRRVHQWYRAARVPIRRRDRGRAQAWSRGRRERVEVPNRGRRVGTGEPGGGRSDYSSDTHAPASGRREEAGAACTSPAKPAGKAGGEIREGPPPH